MGLRVSLFSFAGLYGGGGVEWFIRWDSIRCNLLCHEKLRSADTEKREMKEDFWCFVESASSTNVGYAPFQYGVAFTKHANTGRNNIL